MHVLRGVVLVALGWAMAGCAPADPLDHVVSTSTLSRFAAWRSHLASDSGPELRVSVEEALHELRLSLAGERELQRQLEQPIPAKAETYEEQLRRRVDGRPLREVLQLGCELRLRRLQEELAGLEDAMAKNAKLVTRPGDLESQHHLDGLRERQQARVDKYREEIAATQKRLGPLLLKTGHRLLANERTVARP